MESFGFFFSFDGLVEFFCYDLESSFNMRNQKLWRHIVYESLKELNGELQRCNFGFRKFIAFL